MTALEIREGAMQGRGGWAARKSLDSYDQMKGTEARVVSHALNEAVLALGPLGQAALRRRDDAKVAGQMAHQADVDAGLVRHGDVAVAPLQQEPDSESEEDLEWQVLSIVGTKGKELGRLFHVSWTATADAGEVKTWVPEAQLVEVHWRIAGGPTSRGLRPRRWPRASEPRPQQGEQQQATSLMRQRSIEKAQRAAQGVGQHAVIVRPGGLARGVDVFPQAWMVGVGLTRQSI